MIYLIRHGQTQANEKKQYLGRLESPLTEEGKRQHKAVVRQLEQKHIDYVITSPRERCLTLAEMLCKQHAADLTLEERIAEFNFGVFEKLTFEKAKALYQDEWAQWEKSDRSYVLPCGESIDLFEKRVRDFAKDLLEIGEPQDVAVVTHGGVMTSLLCDLLEFEASAKWRFRANNGAVIQINIADGYAYLEL